MFFLARQFRCEEAAGVIQMKYVKYLQICYVTLRLYLALKMKMKNLKSVLFGEKEKGKTDVTTDAYVSTAINMFKYQKNNWFFSQYSLIYQV